MSLIGDQQRKNAQQEPPVIKPLQVQQPALEVGNSGTTGQEFQLSEEEQPIPETPEVPDAAPQQPSASDFSLTDNAAAPQASFVPKDPLKLINNSIGATNIWQTIPADKTPYSSDVLQTLKPTVYDSSRANTEAERINALGIAGVRSSHDNYSREQQRAAAAETEARNRANSRAENTNIPRKTQPWAAGVGQMFNDVLFGSKQSQEEAERNVINPFKLQYGKQGAGIGGWVKYILSTPLNASVALAADINQQTVDALTIAGVKKEDAQRFARNGFLGLASDAIFGKDKTDAVTRRFGLQQDWSKTEKQYAPFEAVFRGAPYGDINDPAGNSKGVFYRAARPRRTQEEIGKANEGNRGILGAGGVVQAAKDDSVGAGYEILLNILDPAGNAVGDVVATGIRNIAKAPKPKPKSPAKAQGVQTPSVFNPPTKAQRALPPGKVQGTPVEQQLEQLYGNNIPELPRKPGERRLPSSPESPALPMLPGTPPPGGFQMPRVNLGSGIPVTGTRVIQPNAGVLPSGATRKTPTKYVAFPNETEELAQAAKANDPWNAASESPLQMRATIDNTANLSKPELPPSRFRLEETVDPWIDDAVEFVADAKFEPLTSAAATPTKAPRIYLGDFRVVQKSLPPAITNVTEVVPEAIVGTPSEVVFRVGIGNPSSEPIQFADEIVIPGIDDVADEPAIVELTNTDAIKAAESVPSVDLSIPNLRKLGNDWREYQKKRLANKDLSYEEDIAPRIADVAGNMEAGKPERSIQALVEFISKDKTYEDVSSKLGINARKTIDDIWKTLVEAADPAKLKTKVSGIINKSPDEISESEKLLLDKVGLSNWSGKQWVNRKVNTTDATDTVTKAPVNNTVEFSAKVEYTADELTNAKRAEAEELLELTRRYDGDEELTPIELERMSLLEDAQAQGKAIVELTQPNAAKVETEVTPPPAVDKPNVTTWNTKADQPLPNLTWKKHPLASGTVRRVNPQELDKLWRTDRVDTGGAGGIGNRYKEATDFIAKSNEPIIMSELVVAKDGTVTFVDGRHRFATLRDQGFTEIPVVVRNPKYLPDNVRTVTKATDDIPPPPSLETLEQAAEQLASQKAVVQAPLQQLDDVFDTTVDFGRKVTDDLPYSQLTSEQVLEAFEDSAKLNLPPDVKRLLTQKYGNEITQALFDSDYSTLYQSLQKSNNDVQTFVNDISLVNNAIVATKSVATKSVETLANTIKMPAKVLHGTALANWQPSYNLRLNGSRGELGTGLYVTNRKSVATDYAQAIVSENVSPGANAFDTAPAVYELTGAFENTLSARAKLSPSSPLVKALVESLPEELKESVRKSISRDKSTSYVGIVNKVEASLVRSGLSPTEETLKDIGLRLSDTLRSLGYDSVYDSKSGFGLVLDETKVAISKSSPVSKATSPTQAALARYNADAYAAKFYSERLTTDANLRDSAYKLLSQIESNVDDKLAEIQQEIIKRGLDRQQTVLPPKQTYRQGVSLNDSKPTSAQELMETIEPKSTNPCEF